MKVGIPSELEPSESRVAASPKVVQRLKKQGFEVAVQTGAGARAAFSDDEYRAAGAQIVADAPALYAQSDLMIKVLPPRESEVAQMKSGTLLFSTLWPAQNADLLQKLATQGVNALAMDAIPRITRAQKMDVLSSMANIAGYRAVIESAHHFGRFLNGQITAAGKVEPAQVLVIGAGVAGLAAIGVARGLGAVVRAFDTRKEVREQIQSMGAQFLTVEMEEDGSTASGYSKEMSQQFIDVEMALFRAQAKEVDIIITTAQIPGKAAPKLILKDMVESMRPGSVVVDLAAQSGGNCELTRPGEIIQHRGVWIVGKVSQLPTQASQLYGTNICNLLDDMGKAQNFKIDLKDDVVSRALVVRDGKIHWPPAPLPVQAQPASKKTVETQKPKGPTPEEQAAQKAKTTAVVLGVLGLLTGLLGWVSPPDFLAHFTVFVLACFIGWQVVWNVSHALHTPLMSVTNAISGIILLGGIAHMRDSISDPITVLAGIAVLVATINIAGGFYITQRMLRMFRK